MTYTTYRVTYRTQSGKSHCLPVMASDAINARKSLVALGYDVYKVTHCFPSV